MNKEGFVCSLDRIIDEFIARSIVFVNYSCYLPGLKDLQGYDRTIRHVYDHEYLAFAKSAKTLISIRSLLDIGHSEDVYVLIRSLFENYLAARYLNENVHNIEDLKILDEFIQNKIKIAIGYYSVKGRNVVDPEGQKVGEIKSIKSLAMGSDVMYYPDFYAYLSRFTHLDFSIIDYYLNKSFSFDLDKENEPVYSRLFTVFVFTKIFECIVTIRGEDFYNEEEESKCYEIVGESLVIQKEIFNQLLKELDYKANSDVAERQRANLYKMLTKMSLSLSDSIGDFDKSNLF